MTGFFSLHIFHTVTGAQKLCINKESNVLHPAWQNTLNHTHSVSAGRHTCCSHDPRPNANNHTNHLQQPAQKLILPENPPQPNFYWILKSCLADIQLYFSFTDLFWECFQTFDWTRVTGDLSDLLDAVMAYTPYVLRLFDWPFWKFRTTQKQQQQSLKAPKI